MQGFVYKSRYNPIKSSDTPMLNVAHLKYIATKYKEAEYNPGCGFSLWGKLPNQELGNINDFKFAKKTIREVSERRTIYKAILSLDGETADLKNMNCRKSWQDFTEKRMNIIAYEHDMKPENLCWCASFHFKNDHPHTHFMFWDNSTDVRQEFIPTERFVVMTDKIKEKFGKALFADELKQLYHEQDIAKKDFKDDLKIALEQLEKSVTVDKELQKEIDEIIDMSEEKTTCIVDNTLPCQTLNDDRLLAYANKVLEIYQLLPKTGSLDYKYQSPEVKKQLDLATDLVIKAVPSFNQKYASFMAAVNKVTKLYGQEQSGADLHANGAKYKLYNEVGNIVLKWLKANGDTINPLIDMEKNYSPLDKVIDCPWENEVSDDLSVNEILFDYNDNAKITKGDNWWTDDYKLAKKYLYGNKKSEIKQDFIKARKLFENEAALLNPLAICDIGRMVVDGLGCDVNTDEANRWYSEGLNVFLKAEKENPKKYVEYRIGKMYAAEQGTEKDYIKAAEWLKKSADAKYKYAEYSLAGLYLKGNGVELNLETAYGLYVRAANQNFAYASFECGKMLRDGIGCERDIKQSEYYFKAAFNEFKKSEEDNPDDKLQYRIGQMLVSGTGTDINIDLAKKYFEKSAMLGNPFAQYQLAKLILNDENSNEADVLKALAFLEKSSNADNSYAQYFLGKLYESGKYVTSDIKKAIVLFEKSANGDNNFAAYRLGKIFLDGEKVDKDISIALKWLNQSANKNNPFAQYTLGKIYLTGDDVVKNVDLALNHLNASAQQGNEYAQYTLGKIYLTGDDVVKNVDLALNHLNASAQQGNEYAQYTLGKAYLLGKDVEKDKQTAISWLKLSAAQNNEYAQHLLENMDDFFVKSKINMATNLIINLSRLFRSENFNNWKTNLFSKDKSLMQRKNIRQILTNKSTLEWKEGWER